MTDTGRLDREHALQLLHGMLRIRRFEEKCAELYGQLKIRGFLHLYIGEEAIAVGAMRALKDDDAIVATYREHGHALARGIPMTAVMSEMYGKASGCSRGRGGSMHLFDAQRRFYGGNAIVGGGLPLAVGLALADQMQNRPRVTVCFFGEGAAAEGEFHESLNLASLWKLPVLFLCENNLYAMGTSLARSAAETDLHIKATAYHMPGSVIDGMDVVAIEEAAQRAVSEVRAGGGPQLLEIRTYRFRAHSMFDPERYRDKAEVEARKKEGGPLTRFIARGKREHWFDEPDIETLERTIAAEIQASVDFAETSDWEPVADLARDVYTPWPAH